MILVQMISIVIWLSFQYLVSVLINRKNVKNHLEKTKISPRYGKAYRSNVFLPYWQDVETEPTRLGIKKFYSLF